ncbi:hypothetical protein NCC49_005749 [Naganishia albida]|nr:hypothetical protein NCC49_005749 [Naganishia albida]
MSEKPDKRAKPRKRKESAKRKERTAQKKAGYSARHTAIQQEKLLASRFPDAHLDPPPEPRVIDKDLKEAAGWVVVDVLYKGPHIDATDEVHWLTIVNGEKRVFLLPPTRRNLDKYLEGEVRESRGDMVWLADQRAENPVGRVLLKPGMTL